MDYAPPPDGHWPKISRLLALLGAILVTFVLVDLVALVTLRNEAVGRGFQALTTQATLIGKDLVAQVNQTVSMLRTPLGATTSPDLSDELRRAALGALVTSQPGVLYARIDQPGMPHVEALNSTLLSLLGIAAEEIRPSQESLQAHRSELGSRPFSLFNATQPGLPTVLGIWVAPNPLDPNTLAQAPVANALLQLDPGRQLIGRSSLTIALTDGTLLYSSDLRAPGSPESIAGDSVFKEIVANRSVEALTREYRSEQGHFVVSSTRPGLDLVVLIRTDWRRLIGGFYPTAEKIILLSIAIYCLLVLSICSVYWVRSREDERHRKLLLLLLLLAFVFLGAAGAFLGSSRLLETVFPSLKDFRGQQRIGTVASFQGEVRREGESELGFHPVSAGAELYEHDSVMTSEDSTALLLLSDGSTLILDPNTLIRLNIELEPTGKVFGRTEVELISGQVTAQPKTEEIVIKSSDQLVRVTQGSRQSVARKRSRPAPVPSPSPVSSPSPQPSPTSSPSPLPSPEKAPQVWLLEPVDGARLDSPEPIARSARQVLFRWRYGSTMKPLRLVIRQDVASPGKPLQELALTPQPQRVVSRPLTLPSPGRYVWELRLAGSKPSDPPLGAARFSLHDPDTSIVTLPPLIAGRAMRSNEFRGEALRDFSIELRWKPYSGVRDYLVRVYRKPDDVRPLYEKRLTPTRLILNRSKVFNGLLYYAITGQLTKDRWVHSVLEPVSFSFLPPRLVEPRAGSRIARSSLGRAQGRPVLTWQTTNFTEHFEVEIGTHPEFPETVLDTQTDANFYALPMLAPGRYWWRVRSVAKNLKSVFSEPSPFEVTP